MNELRRHFRYAPQFEVLLHARNRQMTKNSSPAITPNSDDIDLCVAVDGETEKTDACTCKQSTCI